MNVQLLAIDPGQPEVKHPFDTIPCVIINHRTMFDNMSTFMYERLNDGESVGDVSTALSSLGSIKGITEAFSDGYTPILMGGLIAKVELLQQFNHPYVVVVMKDDKVFAIVPCDQVKY